MPSAIIRSLEVLMFEAIGMTAIALSRASAGELTLSQWRALVIVGRTAGIRVGDIAGAIGMSLPSTSRMIQRLERRGLVETHRDETDRRATLVSLTSNGSQLRGAVVACRREMMEAALAAFAPTLPNSLVPGLELIAKAFDRYE